VATLLVFLLIHGKNLMAFLKALDERTD